MLENGVVLGQALHLAALIDGETLHTVSNKTLKVWQNSNLGMKLSSCCRDRR